MTLASLSAAFATGALLVLTAQSSAAADPTITDAFLANVRPNVRFLEQSSMLAVAQSKNASLRAYAQSGIAEATKTAAALDGVIAIAQVASATTSAPLLTGRSVAVSPIAGLGQSANGRSPLGRSDLDGLSRLSGRPFLDAFWLKQVDALSQLRADYEDYAANGVDSALVAMSKRELPGIERPPGFA